MVERLLLLRAETTKGFCHERIGRPSLSCLSRALALEVAFSVTELRLTI